MAGELTPGVPSIPKSILLAYITPPGFELILMVANYELIVANVQDKLNDHKLDGAMFVFSLV